MKKTIVMAGVIFAATQMTGCASKRTTDTLINMEAAKTAALESAGFSAKEVSFTDLDLDDRTGQAHYDIDFTVNGLKYEYDIDALTGEVLEYEIEEIRK